MSTKPWILIVGYKSDVYEVMSSIALGMNHVAEGCGVTMVQSVAP